MTETESIRAFLALPPDPEWGASAHALVEELRPASPPASWTRPSSWHLTVKFLGQATREALVSFAEAIALQASQMEPGDLPRGGPAVFPSRGPARVLAVGFAPAAALTGLERLAAAAENAARRLGLEREDRPFRPHVTLARLRARWPAAAVDRFRKTAASWPLPAWKARRCVLYASRLGPAGAVHTELAEWPLGAASASAAGRI
ncbi:MAG TPA: RNA 2',3'-cyclic phosphodiesterase [Thermoanaerobaculia bacterium]|nr:RNA 2',3'-cyclic phosphodiesterase [Thermoanaerobaculia bacterium]